MKAYKVVSVTHYGELRSAWVHDYKDLCVTYEVGVKTRANVRGSCLMAFDTLARAMQWARLTLTGYRYMGDDLDKHPGYDIYECDVTLSKSKMWKCLVTDPSYINWMLKSVMLGKEDEEHVVPRFVDPPEGTVLCSSITLIKKV